MPAAMRRTTRPATRLPLLLVALIVALVSVAACEVGDAAPPDDDPLDLAALALDRHRLLDDDDLEGAAGVTVADVQAFLVRKGSALAGYREGELTAARLIVSAARASDIDVVYLLARIEGESGLISSGTFANLGAATGCACPDGELCDPALAGFGRQVRCAAELVRGYLDDLDTRGTTISGWRVGVGRSTLDPCWVVPQNRATAALYTYTPWVGAYAEGCGTARWGGSSLMGLLHRRFARDLAAAHGDCAFGDGFYCGDNGVAGDPATLYLCDGGVPEVAEVCATACQRMAPGFDDQCAG
jgi:hypothetical protein